MNFNVYGVVMSVAANLGLDVPEIVFDSVIVNIQDDDVYCVAEIKSKDDYLLHIRSFNNVKGFCKCCKDIVDQLLIVYSFLQKQS